MMLDCFKNDNYIPKELNTTQHNKLEVNIILLTIKAKLVFSKFMG